MKYLVELPWTVRSSRYLQASASDRKPFCCKDVRDVMQENAGICSVCIIFGTFWYMRAFVNAFAMTSGMLCRNTQGFAQQYNLRYILVHEGICKCFRNAFRCVSDEMQSLSGPNKLN